MHQTNKVFLSQNITTHKDWNPNEVGVIFNFLILEREMINKRNYVYDELSRSYKRKMWS